MIIKNKAVTTNVRKFLFQWFKLLLTVAAFTYLIIIIFSLPGDEIFNWLKSIDYTTNGLLIIFSVFILAFINWLFESEKWRVLASHLEKTSILKAYTGVLYGVALGMITPKRLGEYAGRIVVLQKENRIKGLLLNSLASLTQLSATLAFGLISLIVALVLFDSGNELFIYNHIYPIAFSFTVFAAIFFIIIFIKPIIKVVSRFTKSKKWQNYLQAFNYVSSKTKYKLFTLSVLRYIIFTLQFYLLVKIFGVEISFLAFLVLQSIVYLVMTIIPVSALAESGVKSSVVLLVFGAFPLLAGNYHDAALISSTLSLWFVNLVIPSLAGILLSFINNIKLKQ